MSVFDKVNELKEAERIINQDKHNAKENKKYLNKYIYLVIFICLLLCFVLTIMIYIPFKMFLNSPTDKSNNTVTYKVGDSVTLNDGSSWNVIEVVDEKNVKLLSTNAIDNDGSINYNNYSIYLTYTYKKNLAKSLNVDQTLISNVSIISGLDLSNLSGVEYYLLNNSTILENGVTPDFVYSSNYLIENVGYDSNTVSAVCTNDGVNLARICNVSNTIMLPIRPVITINKSCIKT